MKKKRGGEEWKRSNNEGKMRKQGRKERDEEKRDSKGKKWIMRK